MKYRLKQDKYGTYYLGDYIPSRRWSEFSDDDLSFTKNILIFKNYNGGANRKVWADFTIELMGAIAEILDDAPCWIKEVHMVAAPRSSADKHSAMADSIKMISRISEDGASGCKVPLTNKSGLIIRQYSIKSSHMSSYYGDRRPGIDDHIFSMHITEKVCKRNVLYLVMDDIITSGNTLMGCYNKLIMTGVDKRNIKFLTIGKTI